MFLAFSYDVEFSSLLHMCFARFMPIIFHDWSVKDSSPIGDVGFQFDMDVISYPGITQSEKFGNMKAELFST